MAIDRKPLSVVVKPSSLFSEGKRLNAVEKLITEIDILPEHYQTVETLYLSNNFIQSVKNISQFVNLKVLSLTNNNVCFLL